MYLTYLYPNTMSSTCVYFNIIFLSIKNFENQLHLCVSKIIFSKNRILLISMPMYKVPYCIKDLIFFGILIFERIMGSSKVSKINSIENFWLYVIF